MTNNIERRMCEHKQKEINGFSEKYQLDKLVYLEQTEDVRSAIEREKQLKRWHRKWKVNLITSLNPKWNDLMK
jgi:putative endonuclease